MRALSLPNLPDHVSPIFREGTDLLWPAAALSPFSPSIADHYVRGFKLVNHLVVGFALGAERPVRPTDAGVDRDHCRSRRRNDAWDVEDIGDVLGVVDLVKKVLFIPFYIHADDEQILRSDRHLGLLNWDEHMARAVLVVAAVAVWRRIVIAPQL